MHDMQPEKPLKHKQARMALLCLIDQRHSWQEYICQWKELKRERTMEKQVLEKGKWKKTQLKEDNSKEMMLHTIVTVHLLWTSHRKHIENNKKQEEKDLKWTWEQTKNVKASHKWYNNTITCFG